MDRDHPISVIDFSLSKLFQPSQRDNTKESISFIYTYNPNRSCHRDLVKKCFTTSKNKNIKDIFSNSEVIMATRQPKNLKKLLTRSKFEMSPQLITPKPVGLYPCGKCTYCRSGYIIPATKFRLYHGD